DLGCGSGILTLFWAKLGAEVLAIDINPLCVKVTSKNLELNRLFAKVFEADVREWEDFTAELILANLYKGLLLDLFKKETFLQGSYYLISGFTVGMEEEIKEGIKNKFKILKRREREAWVSYLLCLS
ncbi:MAG: 50S ribosomal protein L11 methyltransferase, partial [Caldimicrobium sp.]